MRWLTWNLKFDECPHKPTLIQHNHICHFSTDIRSENFIITFIVLNRSVPASTLGTGFPDILSVLFNNSYRFTSASQRPSCTFCKFLPWAHHTATLVAVRLRVAEGCGDRVTMATGWPTEWVTFMERRILANELRPLSQAIFVLT